MQFLGKFGKIVCWRPPWRVGVPIWGDPGSAAGQDSVSSLATFFYCVRVIMHMYKTSGGSTIFPIGVSQLPKVLLFFNFFRRKLHENEKIWTPRGASLAPPLDLPIYSTIHKAASSLVTGRSLQNGKMSMGNRRTERPPDPVLYGGRPSGGFVNRAGRHHTPQPFSTNNFVVL